MRKQIILAYRIIEEAQRVEYWTTVKGVPLFIGVSKKEYRELKKDRDGFIKKYQEFMKEQMEAVKNGK